MPNWCKNILRIEGDELEVKRCIKMLKDAKGNLTFNKIVPMPLPLKKTTSPVPESVPQEERDKLVDRYGTDNWYDWRYKNWGCKQDASESEWKDNQVMFVTPWSPPIEFLKQATIEFPGLTFRMQFSEENIGAFPTGEAEITKDNTHIYGPEIYSKEAKKMADNIWADVWYTGGKK